MLFAMNVIRDLVGVDFPLFAFSHCRDVVAAVSRAGGFGVLGGSTFTPDSLEAELRWIDDHVDGKPYGVDILVPEHQYDTGGMTIGQLAEHLPAEHREFLARLLKDYDVDLRLDGGAADVAPATSPEVGHELMDVAFKHPIRLIANALGIAPDWMIERGKQEGVAVAALVGAKEHAVRQVNAGVDILVAQGTEAGGHGASRTTIDIVPAIVDLAAGRAPVVAAGGIADGRGLAAMMMLGASGVLIGTRFYASVEANGAQEAKERIRMATSNDTVRGVVPDWSRKLFWPAPFTARTLVNDHIRRWTGREVELMQRAGEVAEDYAAAKAAGDFEVAAVFAGEAAGLIHDIPPAAEIVARIAIEAEQLLEGKRNSVTAARDSSLSPSRGG
jgi:nitronate monooxygenase